MQNTLAKTQVCSTKGFLRKVRIKFATQTLNLQRQFPKSAPRHQKLCKTKSKNGSPFLLFLCLLVLGNLHFCKSAVAQSNLVNNFTQQFFQRANSCSNSTPCLQRSTCKIQQCARATSFPVQKLLLPSFNKRSSFGKA